jgi:hypothetical protein
MRATPAIMAQQAGLLPSYVQPSVFPPQIDWHAMHKEEEAGVSVVDNVTTLRQL